MKTPAIFLTMLLAGAGSAAAEETEKCVWESPGEARVTLVFRKDGERYRRETELTLEVLNEKGLLQRYAPGRKSHWVVNSREQSGPQVTGDTYVAPPIAEPKRGVPEPEPIPPFTTLAAGAKITERLDWDDYLLPGAQWRDDRTYYVRVDDSSSFLHTDDEQTRVRFDPRSTCARSNIKVLVGD